MVLLVMRLKPA